MVSMDQRIHKSLQYIASNMASKLGLDQLAQVACLSKSQFHHLFKQEVGTTPFKHIEKVRLDHAYHILIQQPHNIQNLTEQCGYNDYETFSRAFKKKFLLSPDDLAKIVNQIRLSNPEHEAVYITAVDELNWPELQAELTTVSRQLNVSNEDLKAAQVFLVDQVKAGTPVSSDLIKNKYRVTQDHTLADRLLGDDKHINDEDD